jgi:hypothetical protein
LAQVTTTRSAIDRQSTWFRAAAPRQRVKAVAGSVPATASVSLARSFGRVQRISELVVSDLELSAGAIECEDTGGPVVVLLHSARLLPLEGVGHEMPPGPVWDQVVAAMVDGTAER